MVILLVPNNRDAWGTIRHENMVLIAGAAV